MRRMLSVWLLCLPLTALATDQGRISYLEQEVRNLQRQVQVLTRQVGELRNQPARPQARSAVGRSAAAASAADRWIDAERWGQLRPGMDELAVVSSLGPPTSMRQENGARVLLYALEIGSGGFLTGSVTLRDGAVVEVRKPALQ